MDPRHPSNTKTHIDIAVPEGKAWTPGKAQTQRRKAYKACMCRLCALALSPPLTFAEWDAFVGAIEVPTDGIEVTFGRKSNGKGPNFIYRKVS